MASLQGNISPFRMRFGIIKESPQYDILSDSPLRLIDIVSDWVDGSWELKNAGAIARAFAPKKLDCEYVSGFRCAIDVLVIYTWKFWYKRNLLLALSSSLGVKG